MKQRSRCEPVVSRVCSTHAVPSTHTSTHGSASVSVQIVSGHPGGAEARARGLRDSDTDESVPGQGPRRPSMAWRGWRQTHTHGCVRRLSHRPRVAHCFFRSAHAHGGLANHGHSKQTHVAPGAPWAPSMCTHTLTRRRASTADCAVRQSLWRLRLRSQARAPAIRGPQALLLQSQRSCIRHVAQSLARGPASRMHESQRAAPPSPRAPCTLCTELSQTARVRC